MTKIDTNYSIFDEKTMTCLWNRKANRTYSIAFIALSVVVPTFSVVFFYTGIFIRKIKSDLTMFRHFSSGLSHASQSEAIRKTFRIIKGLLASCILFLVSHLPFALIILIDLDDKLPNYVYMFTMTLSHMNSSLNVILYALTNSMIRSGYKNFFNFCLHKKDYSYKISVDSF